MSRATVSFHPAPQGTSALVASASTALDRVMGLMDGFEDDMDCPLCLEEMDISDLNFKPCPCGYQICRFCWHHIKENLNGRCPACRSSYTDETTEFKAIKPDEMKRLQAAKKLRDKRRKEEALTVKNLANVRVRQRAQVHIQGMTSKMANEDTLNQLKGPEQFGHYGKVVKLFMSKRTNPPTPSSAPTHPHHQPVNVYVNYRTAAEAAACIAAMDGATTADGHRLKAIWGTTRYCPTYLKGGKCNNENCMQAHEPGEEIEGAGPTSREEMYTYHAMSDSDMQRSKASSTSTQRKQPEAATLPATASWASKNAAANPPPVSSVSLPPLNLAKSSPTPAQAAAAAAAAAARVIPVSKPQTHPLPARPSSRTASQPPNPTPSPANTVSQSAAPVPKGVKLGKAKAASTPGPIASSSQPPSPVPLPPILPSVLDPEPMYSTFPDLAFGEGTFSFSLDPDLKGKGKASPPPVMVVALDEVPFDRPELDLLPTPGYMGSFDPFSDVGSALDTSDHQSGSSSPPPETAEEAHRRGSRFGFARKNSYGVRPSPDLSSLFARSPFSGRESPASVGSGGAPPGFPAHRPTSAVSAMLPPPSSEHDALWSASAPLPPGVLRSLASPNGSATSSPQLSPRQRSAIPLPPGLIANRPLAPASFPLPPPAPRPSGQPGTVVGKDDILALIAAAQSNAKSQPQQNQQHQQQQQQQPGQFFSDPAILSARLPPSVNGGGNGGGANHFAPNGMVGAAFHSLDGPLPQHQVQQGYRFNPQQQYAPPGVVRGPLLPQLQQQQQAYQQQYR